MRHVSGDQKLHHAPACSCARMRVKRMLPPSISPLGALRRSGNGLLRRAGLLGLAADGQGAAGGEGECHCSLVYNIGRRRANILPPFAKDLPNPAPGQVITIVGRSAEGDEDDGDCQMGCAWLYDAEPARGCMRTNRLSVTPTIADRFSTACHSTGQCLVGTCWRRLLELSALSHTLLQMKW